MLLYHTCPSPLLSYGMLASLSCVLGEELGPHLPTIVERMMESLTSQEGVKVRCMSLYHLYYTAPLIGQIHYDSFDVSLLGFDEEGEKADMEAGIDSDEGIEG